MFHLVLNSKSGKTAPSDSGAAQLRREAGKARQLADSAFGEQERQQLMDVATMLDREAAELEAALALNPEPPTFRR